MKTTREMMLARAQLAGIAVLGTIFVAAVWSWLFVWPVVGIMWAFGALK